MGCPACGRPVLYADYAGDTEGLREDVNALLWPDTADRPAPPEVEAEAPKLAADFREAVAVLPKSKKASAALSRRCLQYILVNKAGAKKSDNLAKQIESVLNKLPSELALNVDAIRQIGNFAAHPIKSTNTGEIVEVEENEAEWLLDVLEELFEYYYVAPAKAEARRKALNKKLGEMGKNSLKAPSKSGSP